MSNRRLPELADALTGDLVELRRFKEILREAEDRLGMSEPDRFEVYAIAAILDDIYQTMENICTRIVKALDEREPIGPSWHHQLLIQVAEPVAGLRPAVIGEETLARLQTLRGFRHVFRHHYGFALEWAKMKPLYEGAPITLARFEADLKRFIAFLRSVSAA